MLTQTCFSELGLKLLDGLKFRQRHNIVSQQIIVVKTSLTVYEKKSETIKVLNILFKRLCLFLLIIRASVRKQPCLPTLQNIHKMLFMSLPGQKKLFENVLLLGSNSASQCRQTGL